MIRDFWSLHLARKTYASGEDYYGTFPEGFENKLMGLGIIKSPFVHLCSGMSELGEHRFDINQKTKATNFQDARKTDLPDEFAEFVLIDCYYTPDDYKKQGQEPISIYEFLKEAMRITKRGGGNCSASYSAPSEAQRNKINSFNCHKYWSRQAIQMLAGF